MKSVRMDKFINFLFEKGIENCIAGDCKNIFEGGCEKSFPSQHPLQLSWHSTMLQPPNKPTTTPASLLPPALLVFLNKTKMTTTTMLVVVMVMKEDKDNKGQQ
ncbi:uncharacterized protein [Apostichopus japonicus]|uniref:uncharacterized protein isoform X2 n=1 Tax=Stichopus japonicus TaxID=307972 RepID=UPI003AB12A5B